jgi:hypothetical protein
MYTSKGFRKYVINVKQLEWDTGPHDEQAIAAVLADRLCCSDSMSEVFVEYMRKEREMTPLLGQEKEQLRQIYNSKHFRNYVENVKQLKWTNGSSEEQAVAAVLADDLNHSDSMEMLSS